MSLFHALAEQQYRDTITIVIVISLLSETFSSETLKRN